MSSTVSYKGSTIATVNNNTKTLKTAGKYLEGDIIITDASGAISNQNKTVNPTTSQQTITADSGYTGLGTVTVTAMPTMTLPTSAASSATSGYTSKATIGRSTSNQYINIPSGYNSSGAYYLISAVANGTEGTPTATKGTVSNNSISVTPSVTNVAGYITGGTKTGTAVSISASELVSGNKTISANGNNIDVTNYATVSVNVGSTAPTIDSLSITPTESAQTFNSSSVDGYKPVTVSAISTTYVGSGITRRSSSDLTASGATVTVPTGYYSSQATKSVSSLTLPTSTSSSATSGYTSKATITLSTSDQYINIGTGYNSTTSYYKISAMTTMTLPTSASSSATSGYSSKATIGRSTSAQYINIPPGYNSTGAYYTISAVANGSATGPSSLSGSSATVSTGTNTITLTKTGVTTTPTVSAGYVSSATASTATVTLTASVTTKAAATITPGTSNQTIAAGTYLTGAQTIAGDADLVGGNILSTANIFGVQGTVVLQTVYTGSSAPSSSTGANGDIYIQS